MTPWTVTTRLLCPWGLSRQEYSSGLPCPPPGDLPSPGIKPRSPALQVDSSPSESPGKPKNTGVGAYPGNLPNPGINQILLHCRRSLWDAAKAALKKEVHSYTGFPQETEKSQINNLTCHLKELEDEEQSPKSAEGRK